MNTASINLSCTVGVQTATDMYLEAIIQHNASASLTHDCSFRLIGSCQSLYEMIWSVWTPYLPSLD